MKLIHIKFILTIIFIILIISIYNLKLKELFFNSSYTDLFTDFKLTVTNIDKKKNEITYSVSFKLAKQVIDEIKEKSKSKTVSYTSIRIRWSPNYYEKIKEKWEMIGKADDKLRFIGNGLSIIYKVEELTTDNKISINNIKQLDGEKNGLIDYLSFNNDIENNQKPNIVTKDLHPKFFTKTLQDLITKGKDIFNKKIEEVEKARLIQEDEDKQECKKKDCIYFSKPDLYGDKKSINVCKRCNNKCPPGSYKIQDCIDGTNTDLICKPHRSCDYRTMLTVKNGTNDSDTICQCIEGYEWPIDKITKEEETNSAYCNPIKGMCHLNPCHENAFCYDNFKEDGKFDNFVCRCDTSKGYVELEKKGVGKDGCLLLPKEHNHLTNKNDLGRRFAGIKVKGVDSKQYSIKTHLDSQFHDNIYQTHLHKHTVEETPTPS